MSFMQENLELTPRPLASKEDKLTDPIAYRYILFREKVEAHGLRIVATTDNGYSINLRTKHKAFLLFECSNCGISVLEL